MASEGLHSCFLSCIHSVKTEILLCARHKGNEMNFTKDCCENQLLNSLFAVGAIHFLAAQIFGTLSERSFSLEAKEAKLALMNRALE